MLLTMERLSQGSDMLVEEGPATKRVMASREQPIGKTGCEARDSLRAREGGGG